MHPHKIPSRSCLAKVPPRNFLAGRSQVRGCRNDRVARAPPVFWRNFGKEACNSFSQALPLLQASWGKSRLEEALSNSQTTKQVSSENTKKENMFVCKRVQRWIWDAIRFVPGVRSLPHGVSHVCQAHGRGNLPWWGQASLFKERSSYEAKENRVFGNFGYFL